MLVKDAEGYLSDKLEIYGALKRNPKILKGYLSDKLGIYGALKRNPKIIKVAIKHGIIEFVEECLRKFGSLAGDQLSAGERMIEIAIRERNEQIVNLICQTLDRLDSKMDNLSRVDRHGNTILHYAAKLAPPAQLNLVTGAVFQMQRELKWFKGVESMISVNDRFKRNKDGVTAQFIFIQQHKKLLKTGEEWMKDTSGSCMVVAALIATVAFAAAFTVPGGNISDSNNTKSGTPILLGEASLTTFVVADAVALFSSTTSVLMFLAIYTSRYSEEDFLRSLPQKLIIGLATLFISMASILVAFCASLFILVGGRYAWAVIPIALFGSGPVSLFAWLQLPLFYEMVHSTYRDRPFQKHKYMDSLAEKNNCKQKKSIMIRVTKVLKSLWLFKVKNRS
ncbi:hypothetical protein MKW92_011550 [Papaver armeniacum]|nr:hypothetical protein MKW92_011550 [Papaver armeniacum]